MKKKTGFTLIELLVVVAIIAVLVAILLPSLTQARRYAVQLQDASNLKTIGIAWRFYANDFGGRVPISHDDWRAFVDWDPKYPISLGMLVKGGYVKIPRGDNVNQLNTYLANDVKDRGILACLESAEAFKWPDPRWYPVWNTYVVDYRNGRYGSGSYNWGQNFPDSNGVWRWHPSSGFLDNMGSGRAQVCCLFFRHPGGANVLFADGHVTSENVGMNYFGEYVPVGYHSLVDHGIDMP